MATQLQQTTEWRSAADGTGYVLVRDDLDENWRVIFLLANRNGGLEIVELRVLPRSSLPAAEEHLEDVAAKCRAAGLLGQGGLERVPTGKPDPAERELRRQLRAARRAYKRAKAEEEALKKSLLDNRPKLPERPLSAATLRERLRPGAVLSYARADLLEAESPEILGAFHRLSPEKLARPSRQSRRPDYFYAAIAAYYQAAFLSRSRRPRVDAAELLGPGWDADAVRDCLTAARKRKLRWPAGQGRRGGELSEHGLDVLRAGPPDGYVGPKVNPEVLTLLEAAATSTEHPAVS